ncbi:acyl-CoA dehydrogenase family protein [Dankookia sp. GCM10030260]|uniref:acyl-CoA dehydrogenase family protein n=1 Tax=Dankookia sp. GCM10030260 TaxID=3273390 RepID=UPI003616F69A
MPHGPASRAAPRTAAISVIRPAAFGAAPDPLDALRAVLPGIAEAATTEDRDGAFPAGSVAALGEAGLLRAPLRRALGGRGWGIEPCGAAPLARALRLVGRASLPLGRLYEGHVNALRLVQRHGTAAQAEAAAGDAMAGMLFAVWNTDAPGEPPLAIDPAGRLAGRKVLCSGAGFATRALVTARPAAMPEAPPRMLLVPLPVGERADLAGWTAQGMRASATGAVDFTGLATSHDMAIGAPGHYLAQPDFSAGAWRFAAVQCGGAEAVLEALLGHLRRTGRGGDPHQAARLGQAAIAAETARLWVESAALRAEAAPATDDAATYANLARTAVERAALDVLELAQRSVGLTAFLRPNPLERLCRDLATYLRQPAPDRALGAAAADILVNGTEWDVR